MMETVEHATAKEMGDEIDGPKKVVKKLVKEEKWGLIQKLADENNSFAIAALEKHKKAVIKKGTATLKKSKKHSKTK